MEMEKGHYTDTEHGEGQKTEERIKKNQVFRAVVVFRAEIMSRPRVSDGRDSVDPIQCLFCLKCH